MVYSCLFVKKPIGRTEPRCNADLARRAGRHDHLVRSRGIGQPATRQRHAVQRRVLSVEAAAESRRRLTGRHVQVKRDERNDVRVDSRVVPDLFHVRQPGDLRDELGVVRKVRPALRVVERRPDRQGPTRWCAANTQGTTIASVAPRRSRPSTRHRAARSSARSRAGRPSGSRTWRGTDTTRNATRRSCRAAAMRLEAHSLTDLRRGRLHHPLGRVWPQCQSDPRRSAPPATRASTTNTQPGPPPLTRFRRVHVAVLSVLWSRDHAQLTGVVRELDRATAPCGPTDYRGGATRCRASAMVDPRAKR